MITNEDISDKLDEILSDLDNDREEFKAFCRNLVKTLTESAATSNLSEEEQKQKSRLDFMNHAITTISILKILFNQKKIEAIKEFRQESGLGLKDAKDIIEKWNEELVELIEPIVQEKLTKLDMSKHISLPYVRRIEYIDSNGRTTLLQHHDNHDVSVSIHDSGETMKIYNRN